ncbi:MAG: mandelate racemase/muconate lactonizing enzyme family protein, partial [Xanthobacteraceae bacterium]
MKITKLRTGIVHFPFDPPIDGGPLQLRSADCVLVFLETDAGLVGEGLVFALNNQRLPVINEMVRSLEPLVLGLDPELGGSFSARAFRDIGFLGRSGVAVIGVAGVDNALWDLRGKAAGLNVARLIGACTTAVPAYHSGGLWIGRSIDELQREAAGFVAQGWRAMK